MLSTFLLSNNRSCCCNCLASTWISFLALAWPWSWPYLLPWRSIPPPIPHLLHPVCNVLAPPVLVSHQHEVHSTLIHTGPHFAAFLVTPPHHQLQLQTSLVAPCHMNWSRNRRPNHSIALCKSRTRPNRGRGRTAISPSLYSVTTRLYISDQSLMSTHIS